jgi:hypothetical protein
MFDLQSLLLDPVYDVWGSTALLTVGTATREVCVLDHRDGVDLVTARGSKTQALVPGIAAEDAVIEIRQSEVPASPKGGRVEIGGRAYTIRTCGLKGTPGEGEWVCALEEA